MLEADAQPSAHAEPLSAAELFRRHARSVVRFLVRFGVPPAEIDDLLQEVFLRVHEQGGYRPGPARPTSWLCAFAVRLASSHRRRARVRAGLAENAPVGAAAEDPAVRVELDAAMRTLDAALQELEVDHRMAFILFELEGESCGSIAAAQGVPLGTVHSRLHHARKRLREALAEHRDGEPARLAGAQR